MLDKIIKLGYSSVEAKELIKVSKNIEEDYNRLLKEYPIQYLIGYVNFYGYKINVNENVLIPRYETEYLVEKTIKYIQNIFNDEIINILDIGCGSGAISIALNNETKSLVDAIDISDYAIEVAKINIKENNSKVNVFKSDIFSNVKNKYNVIISNPPYIDKNEKIMSCVYKYEPHIALFAENNGLFFYEKILKEANQFLKDKYIIAFEIGMNQGNDIKLLANKYFPNNKIIIEKDLSNKDRYAFIINK